LILKDIHDLLSLPFQLLDPEQLISATHCPHIISYSRLMHIGQLPHRFSSGVLGGEQFDFQVASSFGLLGRH
jgi:hypothetical protein